MEKEIDTLDNSEIIETLKRNDRQLSKPEKGEWLYGHNEPGQTFLQYKAQQPVRPNTDQNKIYLLPLGTFSTAQNSVIEYTANYLELFFWLETIIMPPLSDDIISKNYKRVRETGSVQLLAPYILDSVLKKQIPKDAIVLMAITEKDLYPKSSWGFVFGLATLKERVGVSSMYRYSTSVIDSLNYQLCLGRLIKTASHELGHMFSMRHCTFAVCTMNGSNSLAESDSRPNRLCSECLKKLHWNMKFDVRKRIKSLDSFFLRHRLLQDYQTMHADLASIE